MLNKPPGPAQSNGANEMTGRNPSTNRSRTVDAQARPARRVARLGIRANPAVQRDDDSATSTALSFTVTRSGNTAEQSLVGWTVRGSGRNPADSWDFVDNTIPSGQLTFHPGETSREITIKVAKDSIPEPDETFRVTLTNAVGGTIRKRNSHAETAIRQSGSNGWVFDWRDAKRLRGTRGILKTRLRIPNPRAGEPPISVAAVRVDLSKPGINLSNTGRIANWEINSRETQTQTTRGFIRESRTQGTPVVAAINTSYFKLTDANRSVPADLLGFSVSNNQLVSPVATYFPATFLVDKVTGARIQDITPATAPSPSTLNLALSGGFRGEGIVLQDGISQGDTITQNARSALGLSRNNRFLTLLAVNRRLKDPKPTYFGATIRDVGTILAGFGSYTGLNLDGGGSTQLALWKARAEKETLFSRPLDGLERYVGSNLGITYTP